MNSRMSLISLSRSLFNMCLLAIRSRFSRRVITSDGSASVVSLTSYGRRIPWVYLAIESIGLGKKRPRSVILWLSDEERENPLPASLERLVRRGLEIRYCADWGPHKKYWPLIAGDEGETAVIVIADDDVIYPDYWLDVLEETYLAQDAQVVAHRAVVITLDGNEQPKSYSHWVRAAGKQQGSRVLPTGVGGVLYGPRAISAIRSQGDRFTNVAPRADDLWLHFCFVMAGLTAVQVAKTDRRDFIDLRGTGSQTLTSTNVGGGGNDVVFGELWETPEYRSAVLGK